MSQNLAPVSVYIPLRATRTVTGSTTARHSLDANHNGPTSRSNVQLSSVTSLNPSGPPRDLGSTAAQNNRTTSPSIATPNDHSRASSQSPLLPQKDARSSSQASSPKKRSCMQVLWLLWLFAKTHRFHAIYPLLSKTIGISKDEEKKVAVYKSKRHALVQCTVHVLPVLGAITIVTLNLRQYYIGGNLQGAIDQDSSKLGALQFAAKLHELLMLASLGVIVFTAIRRELALGYGLPFGAALTGLQIDSISTLWSMEFWSVVLYASKGSKIGRARRWLIVGLILCRTLLGVSVGPSSANLMRPRMAWWPAGGTTYWISATPDEIFPKMLEVTPAIKNCDTNPDDTACPFGDYTVIGESWLSMWKYLKKLDVMPPSFYIPGKHAERQMVIGTRAGSGEDYLLPNSYTWATVSPAAVADGLAYLQALWVGAVADEPQKLFNWRIDAQSNVETSQPFVFVYCASWYTQYPSNANSFAFPNWSQMGYGPDGFSVPTVAVTNSTTLSTAQQFLEASESTPGLLWLDDPDLRDATGSTANAITRLPAGLQDQSSYCTCSLISGYAPISLQGTRNDLKFVTGYPSGMESFGSKYAIPYNESWTKVFPSAQWLDHLNPELSQLNSTKTSSTSPYVELVKAAGLWHSNPYAAEANSGPITESILASMLVNGIARTAYNASLVGTLRPNWPDLYLPRNPLGNGRDIYDVTEGEKGRSTSFEVTVQIEGYAYSYTGVTQMATIVILLVCCLLAFLHTAYATWTGWCSGSWATASDVTVLALTSEATKGMENTGAGIETMAIFKQGIQIREKDGRLQMLHTPDYTTPRNIIAGVKYG